MFDNRKLNNHINRIHERALRIVYQDYNSTFDEHCVKSVRIRSYSGLYFPKFGDTPYLSVLSPNAGKYGPE